MYRAGALGFALWLLIVFTPAGSYLEASLLKHVLLEIPLLVGIGITAGCLLKPRLSGALDTISLPCILLACFTLAFWMIPRWLDASLSNAMVAYAKYLSVPILVGMPLALSWSNLHFIARGVVKIEFLAMLFRLGWLYQVSPSRLCNNYLLSEQQQLGYLFICIGFACAAIWLFQIFFMRAGYAAQPDVEQLQKT